MNKKVYLAIMVTIVSLVWGHATKVEAETILYVPQDDRPVSLKYTVETAEGAGYDVITPPMYLISGKNYKGQADKIWDWVEENAHRADVMVLSTDTLIYGGLVDSRKHNLPLSTLTNRVNRIESLKKEYPKIPFYGFGTVMRSPRASGGGVEPAYYGDYGPAIFRIAALQDKMDDSRLSDDEMAELMNLQTYVPIEYLQDWFNRRAENMKVNKLLIDLTRNHTFTYFALGHDDTSSLSQSALEGRYLAAYSKNISSSEYGSFPGADQLGLLLIARARVDKLQLHPTFEVTYPLGGAGDTIPHYEDQSVAKTIAEHITAVGGTMITTGKPDVLLAVNTPLTKSTGESEAFANFPMISKSTNSFLDHIETAIHNGVQTNVIDIAYSNGSDNTLVFGLYQRDLLYRVGSYNGWNTASNSIGYAVAQSILATAMPVHNHNKMLTQQYLDNWAYQANIRKDVYRMQDTIRLDNVRYTGELNSKLEDYMNERIQDFAEKYLSLDPRTVSARFPWGRLFETEISVYDEPIAPLQRDIRKQSEAAVATRGASSVDENGLGHVTSTTETSTN